MVVSKYTPPCFAIQVLFSHPSLYVRSHDLLHDYRVRGDSVETPWQLARVPVRPLARSPDALGTPNRLTGTQANRPTTQQLFDGAGFSLAEPRWSVNDCPACDFADGDGRPARSRDSHKEWNAGEAQ